jgi:hypothetical protein
MPNLHAENMTRGNMKFPALFLFVCTIAACSKNSNNQTCDASYTVAAPLTIPQTVEYFASVSDNGASISSISYLDSAGTTTVKNPSLPFTKFVNLQEGVMVTISATGTANAGSHIDISASADGTMSGTTCP